MPNLKTTLKNTALRALRGTGAYSVAANSAARRSKLLILCYHGIALRDEAEWAGHLYITAERFRERMECLRALNASVLPLGDAVARLKANSLPPRSVVITFDDGFYDFLHHGVPILSEFRFPCTLYLTTHYMGKPYPIFNLMLDYLLWKSGQSEVSFSEQGIAEPLSIIDWKRRRDIVQRLVAWLEAQKLDTAAKNGFVSNLATQFEIDYDDLLRSRIGQILTPEEVVRVARAGIDIELHTHRHRTPRIRDQFVREIDDNRVRIAEITGRQPVHFCYPSGVHADDFLPWLHDCGVETATTCERGFARSESNPLLLPRLLDDSNMDLVQFEAFVAGVLS
ncbi:MAG TPA: polysaccharide deacetylase family protein [Bryobacteraceae bacterium]|jgi:peptidoglycan/xylan/chitin deacetylase (PgdA/CDA1 family)|nr:polysaccharide deacetylase family protein [Bryobacteraceae bacterium]